MDDRDRMKAFRRQLPLLMKSTNHTEASLGEAIGGSRSYLRTLLREDKPSDPGASKLLRLAHELNVDLNTLLCFESTKGQVSEDQADGAAEIVLKEVYRIAQHRLRQMEATPSIDQVLTDWRFSNGEGSKIERHIEFFDLYRVPDAKTQRPEPIVIGKQSLAARRFERNDRNYVENVIARADIGFMSEIVADQHQAVSSATPIISTQFRQTSVSDKKSVSAEYIRVILPCRLSKFGNVCATFCRPIDSVLL